MPHLCFIAIDYHTAKGGGGIASYVGTMAPELVRRGWKVSVIAKGDQQQERIDDGIRVLFWPLGNIHWWLYRTRLGRILTLPVREWEWSRDIGRAVRWLHQKDPIDVIEGCETGNLFLPHGEIPIVNRLHGEQYTFAKHSGQRLHWGLRRLRALELIGLRAADALTAPSRFRDTEVAAELGSEPDRIKVIPNPVSEAFLEEAGKAAAARSTRRPSEEVTVLYAGRLSKEKGVLVLLEAAQQVLGHDRDFRFVLAGARHSSVTDADLRRFLNNPVVKDRVELLGHVQPALLREWYWKADIFVMPSYYETFGLSAIEAMALGLPVIASRAAALPEIVTAGETGLLVEPDDAESLAAALTRLADDPGLRKQLGDAGRKEVADRYSPATVASQSCRLYESVLRGPEGGARRC